MRTATAPLSLSAAFHRFTRLGVVGHLLEGITLRLQSSLPTHRLLGQKVAEAFAVLVDPTQPLRFGDSDDDDNDQDGDGPGPSHGHGTMAARTARWFALEFGATDVEWDPLLHVAPRQLPELWTVLTTEEAETAADADADATAAQEAAAAWRAHDEPVEAFGVDLAAAWADVMHVFTGRAPLAVTTQTLPVGLASQLVLPSPVAPAPRPADEEGAPARSGASAAPTTLRALWAAMRQADSVDSQTAVLEVQAM